MATTVALEFKGMGNALELLKQLPPEVVSKRGGPVKAALRKAALVILREAKLNLAHSTDNLTQDGSESTGFLLKNLIASRGKQPAGGNGERYLVRVRRKSYQDRKGKTVTTLKTAHLLEYGSEKQPAEPWLRPAGAKKAQEAIDTMNNELSKSIARVVKKLNKGK